MMVKISKYTLVALSVLLMLLAGSAIAEKEVMNEHPPYVNFIDGSVDAHLIPQSEAVWFFFMSVVDDEYRHPGMGRGLLQEIINSDSNKANDLFVHIRREVENDKLAAKASASSHCQTASKLRSKEALAAELTNLERINEAEHELLITGLSQVLEPPEAERLLDYIDFEVRPSMTLSTVDWYEYLAQDNISLEGIISRMCSKSRP